VKIYCIACNGDVDARLTDGSEIYQHRPDLYDLPFWKCDKCGGFVGCHHKTKNRIAPLGNIPTNEITQARKRIHAVVDPLSQSGSITRKALYSQLTEVLGRQYHTAELRSIAECNLIESALIKKG
jgi:hypothetical protein